LQWSSKTCGGRAATPSIAATADDAVRDISDGAMVLIGGFLTPTGYGTMLAEGKETRVIDGRGYVFETPLHADAALIKALKDDRSGNLVYRKTARIDVPLLPPDTGPRARDDPAGPPGRQGHLGADSSRERGSIEE
jgi:hypothetical protein